MLGLLGNFTAGSLNIGSNVLSMITRFTMRALGALTGAIWGGLRALFSTAVRIVGGGFDLLKTLFRKSFEGLVALGKLALVGFAAAIGATVVAVQKATERLKTAGNAIGDIRGATGMGTNAAGGLFRRFSAYGVPAAMGDTNPYAMRGQAGAWGLPGIGSSGFIPALAGKYQNSDPMMARYMLQSMGLDSPEMRRRLQTPVGMLQEQERFSGQVFAGMGVDPSTIERLTQRTELLGLKFKVLADGVLLKLAESVLPRLLNVGEKIVNVLGGKAGQIGDFIEASVNKAFDALLRFGEFVIRLPEYFFTLADSVLSFVETALGAIPTVWDAFLSGVALIQSALEQLLGFGQTVLGGLIGFGESVLALGPKLQPIYDGILNFLDALSKDPMVQRMIKAAPAAASVGGKIHDAVNTVQQTGENTAKGLGADDSTASLIGILGSYLAFQGIGGVMKWGAGKAGGWALGRLGLGGARAAAGAAAKTGTGNVFSNMLGAGTRAATNPGILARAGTFLAGLPSLGATTLAGASAATIGGVTAIGAGIGTLAGYGFFRGTQALGMNKDKGFLQTLGHGAGQIRDWIMGTPGRTQRDYNLWLQGQADMAKPVIEPPGLGQQVRKAASNATSMARGMAAPGYLMGMLPRFNTNPAGSTWATALDEKFSGRVREFSADGMSQVAAMRARLSEAGAKYNADENIKLLRELLGETKKQTPLMRETAENISDVNDRAAGYAMWQYAKESGAALRRQG